MMYHAQERIVNISGSEKRITADHMGRFRAGPRHRVMDPAALAGDLRARDIHDTFLRVVHHGHTRRDALTHYCTCGQRTVGIERADADTVARRTDCLDE